MLSVLMNGLPSVRFDLMTTQIWTQKAAFVPKTLKKEKNCKEK